MKPTVSVVIPCFNEENHIKTCVESLLYNGFSVDDLEILIIDGESIDNTIEIIKKIAKKHPQVKHINNAKKKTPFALNLGIENAQNNYILIASAHSSFDKGYIQELINKMQELNADVVGGVMETRVKNSTPTSQAIKQVLANKFGVGNSLFRTGVNKPTLVDTVPFGLYKTELLKSVEGYDEKLIRNHDIELSKRVLKVGAKIYLTPSTKCYYYARENYIDLANNNYNNGKWNLLTVYITKDYSSVSFRHFVPFIFVVSLLAPLFLSIVFLPFAYFSLAILLVYFFTIGLVVFKTFDLSKTTFLKSVWSFFILHISYGFGSLIGMFNFNKLL